MPVRKIWKIKNNTVDEDLIGCCNNSRVLAMLLKNRGLDTKEKINRFLNPLKAKLSNPNVFKDMDKAVNRIKTAVEKQEHITIYGDFDADGVTSTSLLYLVLKKIGANVGYYIPDRSSESHGINTKALVQIIAKQKSRLLITVDCGISNISEVNFANGFKTDVIITDHHEAPETLPNAFAILNPKAQNSIDENLDIEEIESLNYLAGVGVAFKLACKLLEEYKMEDFVNEILPIAAIGTIGDVVELIGENRSIVSMGLELIKSGKHFGIQNILKTSGIESPTTITSETIAFSVVPKINAAGRLESPYTALKVLISDNEEEINTAVNTLNDLNKLRQELCDETFQAAKLMYERDIKNNKKSIVLYHEDWHIGIIGIVASKLLETYNKPVFLMTKDANKPNIIRCSCRSINDLNVHSVLSIHKELFEGFGGHKMAAGFSFDETKITFDKFKSILNQTIDEFSQNIDFNTISIDADMELTPDDISIETVELIDKMQPFGSANPSPLFILNKAKLENFRMMGQNNNHLKMFISKDNCSNIECVKWNYPDFNLPLNSDLDILFSMKINNYNNITSVQLMIEDIHSELLEKQIKQNEIKILDHRKKTNILIQVLDFVMNSNKNIGIYIENPALIKQLKLSDEIKEKTFSIDNIPNDIEQLMFFEIPTSKEKFIHIIKTTNANVVHLMNFDFNEITIDNLIVKLSGMIKYAISNLNGTVDVKRAARALSVEEETIDCALTMFENIEMIDLNKIDENNYEITYIHPVELSKVKQNEMISDLETKINDINTFKNFYLNSTIDEIKEEVLC